ncbi:uncharacterized protein DDB_G0283697 isoform X1 [Rosa chinensis]|uniref:uncharacterized protein DDB_G0283697 isoform X1 n=1 Tax=Rosa chinensis TaxID=74649 RepID=UPI000D090C5B|nr:uncharacterized protein DDB_G0283697 isoform X1 [Rosa chinensis]
MPKHSDPSDEETPEDSSSGSEEQNPQDGGVPEYEKQRQARIAHNRARMEALGLPKIASSLMGSAQNATKRKRKGKAKVLEEDDDDEYRPEEASSSEDEANDEDFEDEKSSSARKKKNKGSKPKKARSRRSSLSNSDYLDDDDEALKQAIALSLQDSAVSGVVKANVNERKGENQIQQDSGRKRKNSQFASRLQMTEDEFVLHFFQFDEKCNGGISARDLERVAIAHDFMWTDKEVADMIHLFDSDGDAKLSLEDFRKIVVRCNMIKAPENS